MALGEAKIGSLFTPNVSYLVSQTGILNVLQIVCSSACLAILLSHCQPAYSGSYGNFLGTPQDTFSLLAHFGMITTKALLAGACILSLPTAAIVTCTMLECVVSSGLFFLSLMALLTFSMALHANIPQHEGQYNWRMSVVVVSLFGCFLHAKSSWESYRTFIRASS